MIAVDRMLPGPVGSVLADVRGTVSALTRGVADAYRVYHPGPARTGRTPADRGLAMRAVPVTSSRDRVVLDGWFVPARGPHTVVVCHGMGRTKSDVLDHIALLHAAGHHVFAYDLRNHGRSGRSPGRRRMADRFTADLVDVIDRVATDPDLGTGRVAVLAFSFSTWPAVYALPRTGHPIAAVICDSGPTLDIAASFRHFGGLRRRSLPAAERSGIAFGVYRRAFARAGVSMLGVRGWPPRCPDRTALLFIAGAGDPVLPAAEVMRFARRFAAARAWVAPTATHMNAVRLDRDEYRERVVAFLAESFGADR